MARRGNRKEISEILTEVGEKATEAAKNALSKGADNVVLDAKSRCPVRTGKLRDSIRKKILAKGLKIKIEAGAESDDGTPYGKIVEFSPKINKPFLYPALDAARESIKQSIAGAISEGLKK